MGTLQINILGTSFAIDAKEDTQYLEQLLSYYTKIAAEIEKSNQINDPLKIALLSGIMLCDELYKERSKSANLNKILNKPDESTQKSKNELHEAERLTLKMIQNIDRLLK